jgi:hypothetical protein
VEKSISRGCAGVGEEKVAARREKYVCHSTKYLARKFKFMKKSAEIQIWREYFQTISLSTSRYIRGIFSISVARKTVIVQGRLDYQKHKKIGLVTTMSMLKNFIGKLGKNEPAPQRHIVNLEDDDEYVEVTGVNNDEMDEGWEEVMTVKSPRKTVSVTPLVDVNNNNNNVVTKAVPVQAVQKEILVERVIAAPVVSKEPEWLAKLNANKKTAYLTPSQGVPEYTTSYCMYIHVLCFEYFI